MIIDNVLGRAIDIEISNCSSKLCEIIVFSLTADTLYEVNTNLQIAHTPRATFETEPRACQADKERDRER